MVRDMQVPYDLVKLVGTTFWTRLLSNTRVMRNLSSTIGTSLDVPHVVHIAVVDLQVHVAQLLCLSDEPSDSFIWVYGTHVHEPLVALESLTIEECEKCEGGYDMSFYSHDYMDPSMWPNHVPYKDDDTLPEDDPMPGLVSI
jgi:hypothetical protein